jgi:hypothetical protein
MRTAGGGGSRYGALRCVSIRNGMTGGSGPQITGLSFETASRIAALIREG